jgi:hypothetical protein
MVDQAAIYFGNADADHTRVKHINIHYHFIKEAIHSNAIQLWYCPSKHNPADIFTKPLPPDHHYKLMLGMKHHSFVLKDSPAEEVC